MMLTALSRQYTAEFVKARRRSLFYGALGTLLVFAFLPIPIAISGASSTSIRDWARALVSFPGCVQNLLMLTSALLPILVAMVAAGAVGGEYSGGTWKMTLPRTRSRASPLLAKFLAVLTLSLGALVAALLFTTAMGAVGCLILGLPFLPVPVELNAGTLGRQAAYIVLEFSCFISLAMFASVLTRSLIGGALLGYVAQHLLRATTYLPYGWLSPMTNLELLQAKWMSQSSRRIEDLEAAMGRAMSWQASLATVLFFTLGFLLLSMWLFEKRDLTSE
jgi:ABC-type transport system involved in multi-copper enzyme maturation permease subunit